MGVSGHGPQALVGSSIFLVLGLVAPQSLGLPGPGSADQTILNHRPPGKLLFMLFSMKRGKNLDFLKSCFCFAS